MEIEAHLDDNIAEDTLKTNNHSLYAPDTMEAEEQVFPRMEKNMEDRGKKSQYIVKKFDSNDDEDEVVYIAIKDEFDDEENEKMVLISHVRKNDTQIYWKYKSN